jgi:hypothetical protein
VGQNQLEHVCPFKPTICAGAKGAYRAWQYAQLHRPGLGRGQIEGPPDPAFLDKLYHFIFTLVDQADHRPNCE